MSRVISRHPLQSTGQTTVSLQRRARILSVVAGFKGPELIAECEQDETTRALDVRHSREFVVLEPGASAPAGAGYIGSCVLGRISGASNIAVVYELPGVKPQGL